MHSLILIIFNAKLTVFCNSRLSMIGYIGAMEWWKSHLCHTRFGLTELSQNRENKNA